MRFPFIGFLFSANADGLQFEESVANDRRDNDGYFRRHGVPVPGEFTVPEYRKRAAKFDNLKTLFGFEVTDANLAKLVKM